MKAAILTDTTKCIGCRECVVACKKVNHLQNDIPRRWDLDDGLSARNWTSLIGESTDKYVRSNAAIVWSPPVSPPARSEPCTRPKLER